MNNPFQTLGIAGGVDRTGVKRITVPVYVATLAEAVAIDTGSIAKNNGIPGYPCVGMPFSQTEDGGFLVTCQYEAGSPTYSDDQITFELDTTMAEDPIESHPNFEAIAAKYGWLPTDRAFPMDIRSQSKDRPLSGNTAGQANTATNQLYGTESYLAVGAVFRKTYAANGIPGGILKGIGAITTNPPGVGQFVLPNPTGARNWLKLAPKIRRRGNCVEITEEWMLSGPRGWNSDVYSVGQLEVRHV